MIKECIVPENLHLNPQVCARRWDAENRCIEIDGVNLVNDS